ncbi:MAG TPA: hypothetical protein VKG38_15240 [Solirubrobacteraceae bacterium]|nr:hypothetical protein [Solirubrobacteraceae bacterium]
MTDAMLVSWHDGKAARAILDFVDSVTADGSDFVEPADRIATFDNDGTLWCEKPTYVQADFLLRRMREMIDAQPALATEQPYKAIAENDRDFLSHFWTRAGRKPLLAAGNSDGDIAMLEIARFSVLINHDDAQREFAFTELAEDALAEAAQRDWTVVSMKDDWTTVF